MTTLSELTRSQLARGHAKKLLAEKYQAKMNFAYAEGLWRAGPELLVLLSVCPETAVLEDLYGNPIRVTAAELRALALERWQEQMNAWHAELDELK